MTLACLDISSKKSCLYRLFIYHFKAHTISNKLVLKISAQKKGKKSYDSSNMCSNFFVVSGIVPLVGYFTAPLSFLVDGPNGPHIFSYFFSAQYLGQPTSQLVIKGCTKQSKTK